MEKRQKFSIFADMKRFCWIGVLVLLVLAACNRPDDASVETRRATSLPTTIASPELSAIDSLMWHQPDSALARLIPNFDTCTTTEYNRHYANLLLSELLYKNDYAQTNRPALLQAITYFDSLTLTLNDTPKPKRLIAGTDPLSLTRNDNLAFLDSRAHYINGVGYYENDSVVEACSEYLKALELMENHYDEKDLVGKKAKFMTYTYNRLGDMFSEQFMTEPSIDCYESALVYCRIESTSDYGVSNISCRIGNQYDMIGKKDSALFYYEKAMANLPNFNGVIYRDILSCKTFLSFQLNHDVRTAMDNLYAIVKQTTDDYEKLTRYLTIGDIYFEEKQFDSARVYLEYVFENSDDMTSKIQAVDYLCKIYESSGEQDRLNECLRFLAEHRKSEGQNKVMVSKLEELFKSYLNKKREKQAEGERKKAVKKAVGIIIPMAIMVVSAIVFTKRRGKKMLKKQREETMEIFEEVEKQHELTLQRQQTEAKTLLEEKERQLEKERKARQREKEKLQQGLQLREEQVSALEKALGQQREKAESRREAFMNEAICCKINDSIRCLRITARNSHKKHVSFTEEDAAALKAAVLKHYGNFESMLLGKYPKMCNDDLQICQLYLMGLDERQIAVLQNKSYSAIKKRANSLKNLLGLDENLQSYILKFSSFRET